MQNEESFAPLERAVEEALLANPTAKEAIAVKTAEGNIYCTPISDIETHTDALDFAQSLVEMDDTEVRYVLAKWQGGSLTVTALAFTRKLIAINPKNADAQIMLQGFGQRNIHSLKDTLPPEK